MLTELLTHLLILLGKVSFNLVDTSLGAVRGILTEYDNTYYYSYLGIPYAEAPTGHYRFQPPVPKEPWRGVFNATEEGPVCPQPEGVYKKNQMNEDCLNLNIFAPINMGSALPVMVHIHGGEFKSLSGRPDWMYGPQFFIKRGIMVVTLNYRLGALGFFSTGTDRAAGNFGIKDVLLALQWIKENIKSFGGDPEDITLGGNSAGAAIVHILTMTERSTELFHKAYLISGSALGYRFINRYPRESAKALGNYLGYNTTDLDEFMKSLRQADVFDIVEAQEKIGANDTRGAIRPYAPFVPCIEEESIHAILTEEPLKIIQSGIPHNVPILAGFNKNEGIKMLPAIHEKPELIQYINDNFELAIPSNIQYPLGSERSKALATSIKEFYFDYEQWSVNTTHQFEEFITDTQFTYSIDKWIHIHKSFNGKKDLYYYVFGFDGDLNWFKIYKNIHYEGTAHADELGYFFMTNVTKDIIQNASADSKQTMNTLLTLWTSFIKFGNPNSESDLPFTWEPITNSSEMKYLMIDSNTRMFYTRPIEDRLNFWYQVYNQYNGYYENGGVIEPKLIP